MTARSTDVRSGDAATVLAAREAHLRVLHELRIAARLSGSFEAAYVTFVRSLREQLHPRGMRDIRTVDLDGLTVALDLGDRLGCDIYYGYYEEAFDARVFAASIPPEATVIDIGANFGYYTLMSARAIGRGGAVHAFEPDPSALEMLTRNVEANGFEERVSVWPVAVGETDGQAELQLAEESAFSAINATGRSKLRGSLQVPLRSLDSFAAEFGLETIDALKIDAEGLEADIVRGALRLIRASPDPVLMLEVSPKNLTDVTQPALTKALEQLYASRFHALVPDIAAVDGIRIVSTPDDAARLLNTNVFFVRIGGDAEARVRRSTAELLGQPTALIDTRPGAGDSRTLNLYAGLDPALVAAALREKAEIEDRAIALNAEVADLRADYAKLTDLVEHLSVTRTELRAAAEHGDLEVRRQSAEVIELRAVIEQSEAVTKRQSVEVTELRSAVQQGQDIIQRQAEEITELRELVETAKAQIADWRNLASRQEVDAFELRGYLSRAESSLIEQRKLVEQLQAKLTVAGGACE